MNPIFLFFVSVAVFSAPSWGQDRNYLCNNIIWGTHTGYPWENGQNMALTKSLDESLKRSSQIVHWYANWDDGTGDFLGANQQPLWLKWATSYSSVGNSQHTPMITWQPWAKPYDKNNNAYPFNSISSGKFDAYIDKAASGMKAWGKPMFLRPFHEFDGDWYPWGAQTNNAASFKSAWIHVRDRFRAKGVNNVQFVWCPNHSNSKGVEQTAYYPGDEHVDWACIDVYAESPATSFADSVGRYMNPKDIYQRIAKVTKKPIMLAEFGVKPANGKNVPSRASWYKQLAIDLPTKFPQIKALVHYNKYDYALKDQESLNAVASLFGNCESTASVDAVIASNQNQLVGHSGVTNASPSLLLLGILSAVLFYVF